MNDDLKTFCPKCGAEMKINARYCMHCGYLNYNHPDNKKMQQFAKENDIQQTKYEIGSGSLIQNNNNNKGSINVSLSTGNKKIFFLFNLLILLGLVLGGLLITSLKYGTDLTKIINSTYPFFLMIGVLIYLYVVSFEIIFMKTNKMWWKALIPIYNFAILTEITMNSKWYALLFLIPIINIIFLFIVFYKLGKSFGYSGLLCAILFLIYIPIIAFTGNSFKGVNYVSDNEKDALEKEYKMFHVLGIVIVFVFIISLFVTIYSNFSLVINGFDEVKKYSYINLSNEVVTKVKKAIESGNYSCNTGDKIKEGEIYNFYSHYISDDFDLKLVNSDKFMINIMVIKNVDTYLYYVSFSDGEIGFSNVLDNEITTKSFLKTGNINIDENKKCIIHF